MIEKNNPFQLPIKSRGLAKGLEKLLGLDKLASIYERRPNYDTANAAEHVDEFMQFALSELHADVEIANPQALGNIPRSGSTLLISNHPLGGLEGVAMTLHLRKVRPDLKVLTNELLSRIPEFGDVFINVDVLSNNAKSKNILAMRQVVRHLKKGGALLIYPAGMVSAINTSNWRIEDRAWSNVIGKLVKQFETTCVPCYVHGRNSRLFYLAGLIHPRFRTALLPRELLNKANVHASLRVGAPIMSKDMRSLDDANNITAYLRTATELLSTVSDNNNTTEFFTYPPLQRHKRSKTDTKIVKEKLQTLIEFRLLQHSDFDVYCVPYKELGIIMKEIAVARERTFRASGEGTGFEMDSDHFDPHYLHLFVWDRNQLALVGGYRIGCVDEIVAAKGVDGLYSRSLYHFDEKYISRMGRTLEMGRSFVCPEYQRHPRALDLLWKGIGRWVAQNPDYHTLFGCVSISREHSTRALAFLKDSLMESFRAEQEFLNDVRPTAPLRIRDRVWSKKTLKSLSNLTLINKLLGQCDPGKTVPVLLRHYLALNGRFIGFTVNHAFNDSLDGLIMVDLRKTPIKYLQRYLGKTGSESFIKQWSLNLAAA